MAWPHNQTFVYRQDVLGRWTRSNDLFVESYGSSAVAVSGNAVAMAVGGIFRYTFMTKFSSDPRDLFKNYFNLPFGSLLVLPSALTSLLMSFMYTA